MFVNFAQKKMGDGPGNVQSAQNRGCPTWQFFPTKRFFEFAEFCEVCKFDPPTVDMV